MLWVGWEAFADLHTWDGHYSAGTVYTWTSGTWGSWVLFRAIAGSIAAFFVAELLRAVAGPSGRPAESRW